MRTGSGSDDRAGIGALWRHARAAEQAVAVGAAVMLFVLATLAVLEPAMILPALLTLVVQAGLLVAFRRKLRPALRHERVVREEAARGIDELERWLASRRHA